MKVLSEELINKIKGVANKSFTTARVRQTKTSISDALLIPYEFF
jgi:hypothetical protein